MCDVSLCAMQLDRQAGELQMHALLKVQTVLRVPDAQQCCCVLS